MKLEVEFNIDTQRMELCLHDKGKASYVYAEPKWDQRETLMYLAKWLNRCFEELEHGSRS